MPQPNTSPDAFAIIMAGGKGERFWPQSRVSHPKQLLRLLGSLTLIEQTVARLLPVFPPENILIITNRDYEAPMRSLVSSIPPENIIGEPVGRDTAPCIAYASALVRMRSVSPDPVLCFFASDHVIHDTSSFQTNVHDCIRFAGSSASIVTIGIEPTFPSTGYGYIEIGDNLHADAKTVFHKSLGFREKPSLETAKQYCGGKHHKWNSGTFFMRESTLDAALKQFAPAIAKFRADAAALLKQPGASLDALYAAAPKLSFDYAVMEKWPDVTAAISDFDWDDVGSWTSMRNQITMEDGSNVVRGLHVGLDTQNSIIIGSPNHLIATVDVDDLVIVHTDDATLVCSAKSTQRIKELVKLIGSHPELESFL